MIFFKACGTFSGLLIILDFLNLPLDSFDHSALFAGVKLHSLSILEGSRGVREPLWDASGS